MEKEVRDFIKEFSIEQEKIMLLHDEIKKDSWKDVTIFILLDKLKEEYKEIEDTCDSPILPQEIIVNKLRRELIDLANICAMIWKRTEIFNKKWGKVTNSIYEVRGKGFSIQIDFHSIDYDELWHELRKAKEELRKHKYKEVY